MINAYAAQAARRPLEPYRYEAGPLAPTDVEIAVTHCGICHSDLHLINNDWAITTYPLVPGHEIVGEIVETGSAAKGLKRGDRVGVGWLAGSCMTCESCTEGHENTCAGWRPTCVAQHGGFADRVRADYRFAFEVPKGLESDVAAPLLCGGATVFTPLADHDVGEGARVGVVGVGGLGHLGLQFARARGCTVTAFSTSPAKKAEAQEMGATNFVVLGDEDALAAAAGTQDFIMTTAPGDLAWDVMLGLLRPRGALCVLGVPSSAIQFQAFPLIAGHKKIVGSNTGSRKGIAKMLETAAKKGVRPLIERFPLAEVNTALDRLGKNEIRYRAVLVA
jgi:uncharacterized zinc-type alcohol dehydrogenase-like protein